MTKFHFTPFEGRRPPPPIPFSQNREALFQFLATLAAALGAWYLAWRWTHTLNRDALWLSIPVALAETGSFVGLVLFFYNLWATRDTPPLPPPRTRAEAGLRQDPESDVRAQDAPIRVDFLIATCNEDPELVRLTIRDAAAVRIPPGVSARILVLDDGCRQALAQVCAQEGVDWIPRESSEGFKAGNLANGMAEGEGDFLVICDADLRLFPDFLVNTLGYFRDPAVAWVQTPHWFYDIPPGRRIIPSALARYAPSWLRRIRVGADPFGSAPGLFFDVIQRRRNRTGGSFCCGAASIHRRAALEEIACQQAARESARLSEASPSLTGALDQRAARNLRGIRPFEHHVSEDIFTSIRLHQTGRWRSVYHPWVESRLLSPWDLRSWAIQRLKYAGGSLDIALFGRSVLSPGLRPSHRLYYASTFWSYVSALFIVTLLLAPVLSLATGVSPVNAWSSAFFAHLLPFLLANEAALIVGTWGHNPLAGRAQTVGCVWINLYAMWLVLRRRRIRFRPTPKSRSEAGNWRFALPHMIYVAGGAVATGLALWRLSGAPTPEAQAAFLVNATWMLVNTGLTLPTIRAAFWRPPAHLMEESANDHDQLARQPTVGARRSQPGEPSATGGDREPALARGAA